MLKGRGCQRCSSILLSRVLSAVAAVPKVSPPSLALPRALPPSTTRPPPDSPQWTRSSRHKSSPWVMEAAVAAAAQPVRGGNSRFSVRLSSAHTLPSPSSSLGSSALTSTVKMTGSERQGLFILIYREKKSSLSIYEDCIAKWKRGSHYCFKRVSY